MVKVTRTYAILEISDAAFQEIARLLRAAGYDHAFDDTNGQVVIDMHGIALKVNNFGLDSVDHEHTPIPQDEADEDRLENGEGLDVLRGYMED